MIQPNPPKTISAGVASDLFYKANGNEIDGWVRVADQYISVRRWESHHWLVLAEVAGKETWGLEYSKGLTEMQDNTFPWEGADDSAQLPLTRLYPRTVTTVVYDPTPVTP